MICYCCCRQSSQKPSIELQKSFKPYLEAIKFNPNNPPTSSAGHANAPSLNALDVATLNPRYVSPPFRSPNQVPQATVHHYPPLLSWYAMTNHPIAVTGNSPSTTTSRMPTPLLELPRPNSGTLAAPASPPRCLTQTAPRSTPSQTKCQATTLPPLVAQTPSTTRKQVTSTLRVLVWA